MAQWPVLLCKVKRSIVRGMEPMAAALIGSEYVRDGDGNERVGP